MHAMQVTANDIELEAGIAIGTQKEKDEEWTMEKKLQRRKEGEL